MTRSRSRDSEAFAESSLRTGGKRHVYCSYVTLSYVTVLEGGLRVTQQLWYLGDFLAIFLLKILAREDCELCGEPLRALTARSARTLRRTGSLSLLRARNRGYYVRGSRNALRAYYVPIACTYWARNALHAQYVPIACP